MALSCVWCCMRSTGASTSTTTMARSGVRIAVVGDVHDEWNDIDDARALKMLQPDLVLFTGDFGDENVELVHSISRLDLSKAVILGNHDCWYSTGFFARDSNAVEAQLRRFGIKGMNHSARKISSLALQAPTEHVLVFLGHNGPTGLGTEPADICGKDWIPNSSGDHGDPDLEAALKIVKEKGLHNVQLVVFGHMHKKLLLNRGNRTMLVRGQDGIIYVNAAVVPRVIVKESNDRKLQSLRNFTIIDLVDMQVEKVAETWVRVGDNVSVEQEIVLYSTLEKGFAD